MKLLCLLAIVGCVAASDPTYNAPHKGPSIYDLKQWVQALETDLHGLAKNISDATTLCAVVEDELVEIKDFFIASITTKNKQQSELIVTYTAQAKALQHKVDEAKAKEKQAISLAEATLASVTDQIDNYLNGSGIKGVNMKQQMEIDDLDKELDECKKEFLYNLTDIITHLEKKQDEVETKITTLGDFVAKRKCEYGFGFVGEGNTQVDFKTKFVEKPTVLMSVNGFIAHLDNYKNTYDVLSFSKEVKAESTDFFTMATYDDSKGQVDVKLLSCTWMACQFLDQDINLEHPA